MRAVTVQSSARDLWNLAKRQHGVISHEQLVAAGLTDKAILHRVARGRLHRLFRGVYAVGRPEVSQFGWWTAAVLASGEGAVLSHDDAAALWDLRKKRRGQIQVSVPASRRIRRDGIAVHRRLNLTAGDRTRQRGIPVTRPAVTIVDTALSLVERDLERMINEADQQNVIRFDVLQRELERMARRPGVGTVKRLVLRHTFRLTRSELERLFLAIARRAGLPVPETLAIVNDFEVDFWFPELGLVVEAKSLTYHRTPSKQTADVLRDQTHVVNEVIPLHFTHWQIAKQPGYVEDVLRRVAQRRRAAVKPAAA